MSPDVGVRQLRIVTALEATGADLPRHYRAGEWVPHVSVATRAPGTTLATVVNMVAEALPLTVRVDRPALVGSSTGQAWTLPHIP